MSRLQQNGTAHIEPPTGAPERAAMWCCLLLDAFEDRFERMVRGVWQCITNTFPELFLRVARAAARVACKLARVTGLAALWVVICFGPLFLLARGPWLLVLLGLLWTGFALIGSVWGLNYARRRARQVQGERGELVEIVEVVV